MEKKTFTLSLKVETHAKLKRLAKSEGMPMGIYLDLLIAKQSETKPPERK